MIEWFMYNQHNKVTEDPSIITISRKWKAEYLTIVKVYLDVRTHNGKWLRTTEAFV